MRRAFLCGLLLVLSGILFVHFQPVGAATCTYAQRVGTVADGWNHNANWSCGGIPGSGDSVIIAAGTSTNIGTQPSAASSTVKSITVQTSGIAGVGSLTLASGISIAATSTVTVNGSFNVNAGAVSTTALTINADGNFIVTTGAASSTTITNAGAISITTGTVTSTGTLTNTGSITFHSNGMLDLASDFTNSGTFTSATGTTRLAGGNNQSITGAVFYNLTSNKTGGTATLTSSSTVMGALNMTTGGTMSIGSNNMNVMGAVTVGTDTTFALANAHVTSTGVLTNAGSVVFNSNGLLNLLSDFTNSGTFTSATGTTRFVGSNDQSISGAVFYDLASTKSGGTATLTSSSTVMGALNITTGGTLNVGATHMNVMGALTIGSDTTLTSVSGTVTSTGALTNNGTLNAGSGTLGLRYTFTNGGTFNPQTGTVLYSSSTASTITATVYNNLRVTGGVTFSTTASTTSVGTTTVDSGTTFAIGANTYTGTGAFTNNGTISKTTGLLVHAAESVGFTDSSSAAKTEFTPTETMYVTVQDSGRNTNGTAADSFTIAVTANVAAGNDSEVITLTETSVNSGIFCGGVSIVGVSATPANGNGVFELRASGSGSATYTDDQESTGISVTFTYSGSGGGIGGGIPAPIITYQSTAAHVGTTRNPNAVADLANLHTIGVALHALVRTQTDSAVYYIGTDGRRHAFINSRVYDTWYNDFSGVRMIDPVALATIPLGPMVHYKPGVRMVKFTTDARVYAVSLYGELRWIKTEPVASTLYGASWNKQIDDLSDAFYTSYVFGQDIASATDFNSAAQSTMADTISTDLVSTVFLKQGEI